MKRSGPPERRTALSRGEKGLSRGKGLERKPTPQRAPSAPVARSQPPKRKPKPRRSPELAARQEAWKVAVCAGRRCVVCRSKRNVKGHHAPLRQRIERMGGDPWDPRCGVPVCDDCHGRHHASNSSRRILRGELPPAVWDFARDLGEPALVALEREYPE